MLKIAMAQDPEGSYALMDLRDIDRCSGPYDGIFASGCLYHLTKPEFAQCVQSCRGAAVIGGRVLLQHERRAKASDLKRSRDHDTREALKPESVCKESGSTLIISARSCCRHCKASKFCTSKSWFLATGDLSFGFAKLVGQNAADCVREVLPAG